MKAATIKAGDIVKCDVKGRIFFAEVTTTPPPGSRNFGIRAITRGTWTIVTSQQIIGHYAKRKGSV